MLKVVVCVKAVPDPKNVSKIKIDPEKKTLMRCNVPMVINPVDRHGLEAGLTLKRSIGASVTAIGMGPPSAENILKECLALGADHGILLSDSAFSGADAFATAYTLSKGIKRNGPFDLLLCGYASSDGATEWVGPQLATILKLPVITMVREIQTVEERNWIIKADWDDGYRLVSVELPVLLTVTRSLNQPRALSFSGVIESRRKQVSSWNLKDLSLTPDEVGSLGSPTIVSNLGIFKNRRSVKMVNGTADEKADKLVEILSRSGAIG